MPVALTPHAASPRAIRISDLRTVSPAVIGAVEHAANTLRAFNDALLLVCRYVIIVIVGVLAVILIAAVLWRYGFNSAISWSEEGCKYLMVWLAFLGAPIALRQFAHINVDLLHQASPPRIRQALQVVVALTIAFTMAILVWKGVAFTKLGIRQIASSFNLSMGYMYVAVPIGAALTGLVAIEHALRSVVGVGDPSRGLHEEHATVSVE